MPTLATWNFSCVFAITFVMLNASPVPSRRSALVVLAIALGCAGESGTCEERSGTYSARFIETSGNCGLVPDQVITIDAQPTAPEPPCTGEIRYSGDNCEVTLIDNVCPEPGIGEGVSSTVNGKAQWSAEGDQGDAILNMVIRDASGTVLCQSSYDVEYDRI